jgi:hypothetical protein
VHVAGMLSQFFVLSPRGDVIIRRDYLGNVPKVDMQLGVAPTSDRHLLAPCCRQVPRSFFGTPSSGRREMRHHLSSWSTGSHIFT